MSNGSGNEFWSGAGGAAIGAGAGLIGSAISAAKAKKEAARQRSWAETMYGKRYQMTMADMRAAGLNPILAYKTGVGSVPSGARADVPDFGKGVAQSAKAGLMASQELKNLRAVERKDRKLGDLAGTQQDNVAQDTWIKRAQRQLYEAQIPSALVSKQYYEGPIGQWSKKWEQFRHDVGLAFPFTGRAGGARIK